ncbi:MAG: prepilin peptidase [Bacillota bacterium]
MYVYIHAATGILTGTAVAAYVFAGLKQSVKSRVEYLVVPVLSGLCSLFILEGISNGFYIDMLSLVPYSVLIGISYVDIKTKQIPVALIVLFTITIALNLGFSDINLYSCFMGFLSAAALFLLIFFISKGNLGIGDVIIFALTGLLIGFEEALTTIFAASIISGLSGLIMILVKKENSKKSIAFTPFIILGIILSTIN